MTRVSVRTFVEFLFKSGDIDNRVRAASETAMREGGRIHRKLQASRGPMYAAEVPLSYVYDTGRHEILIEGRADGVMTGGFDGAEKSAQKDAQMTLEELTKRAIPDDKDEAKDVDWSETPMIEEIKGTYRNVEKMEDPVPVHLAQAKCYAYFLCLEECLTRVRVRMTYCNLDNEALRFFHSQYTVDELRDWFEALVRRFQVWTDYRYDWEALRTASIKKTVFPYAYRPGQKDLAGAVYRTIVHGRKLFLEAPTGTGKTLATLFPAIKAIGEGKANRVFYLTARTITRTAPEDALQLMREKSGLHFKSVTLTAKEKICLNETCDCNPDACPYAKGHFDRVDDAAYDLLTREERLTRETIETYAKKHTVCPFELALDVSLFADAIICDYNYLFDPFVYLRRFFADGEKNDHLFLVDEAHNLVDRGREMYSAQLCQALFSDAYRAIANVKSLSAVRDAIGRVSDALEQMSEAAKGLQETAYASYERIDALMERVAKLNQALSEYLDDREARAKKHREELLQLYLTLFRFRTIYDGMDARYRIYGRVEKKEGFTLRIFCVDPSDDLAACMAKGVSTTLFSATLLPVQYYKRLLGGTKEDYEIYAETCFDHERCARAIVEDVTSRYTARSETLYRRVAHAIRETIGAKKGNYIVFFPSFTFLQEVLRQYRALHGNPRDERLLVQAENMPEEERERFLQAFQAGEKDLGGAIDARIGMETDEVDDVGVTLFAVLGGIFSEGVDLPDEALIGVVIVGTGLPQLSVERNILRDWFDEAGEDGFDYAYRFPGMNRVLQAAGRVIRTQNDVGVVALLDERFTQNAYRSLFPREWKGILTTKTDEVGRLLNDFWNRWGEPS